VRARGLAYYLVVFQGAQALGAVIWGAIADRTSVATALLIAAAVLVTGALAGYAVPCPIPRTWTGRRRRTGRHRS